MPFLSLFINISVSYNIFLSVICFLNWIQAVFSSFPQQKSKFKSHFEAFSLALFTLLLVTEVARYRYSTHFFVSTFAQIFIFICLSFLFFIIAIKKV